MASFSGRGGAFSGRSGVSIGGGVALPSPAITSYTRETKTLVGTAEPGATVNILADGVGVATVTADDAGAWSYVFGTAPATGVTLSATQTKPFTSGSSNFVIVPPATISLGPLGLSAASFTAGATAGTVIGAIQNKTSGSTITIEPADGRVAISGNNVVVGLTPATAGSFSITLRETLAGATNSPRDTAISLTANASAFPTSAFTAAGGYLRFESDNPGNNAVAVSQTFQPIDVNTSTSRITIPDAGFGAFGTFSSMKGTRGWFTTTGALPDGPEGGLLPGDAQDGPFYYRVDNGDGTMTAYPTATDADWAILKGAIQGERVLPAQRYAEGVGAVVLTSGGSGTHTFHTHPLARSTISRDTAAAYASEAQSSTDKNTFQEFVTDANGNLALYGDRLGAQPQNGGTYRGYGKGYDLGPSALRQQFKGEVAQKRWLWQVFVGKADKERERVVVKQNIYPGNGSVDTANNRIQSPAATFVTGDWVKLLKWPGSAIPGGFTEGTGRYIRVTGSAPTFYYTFHANPTDAGTGANPDTISSAGGSFVIYAPKRVGDINRYRFTDEVGEPGDASAQGGTGNAMATRVPFEGHKFKFSDFSSAGPTAGEITTGQTIATGTRVVAWLPPEAVGPRRTDNGQTLAAGTFYISVVSGKWRVHLSQQSAFEDTDTATASSGCLKFDQAGDGEIVFYIDDDSVPMTFDHERSIGGVMPAFVKRIPGNKPVIIFDAVDYDDPTATGVIGMQAVNSASDERIDQTTYTKGLTDVLMTPYAAGTDMNSAARHAGWIGTRNDLYRGSGVGSFPTSSIQAVIDYLKTARGISDTAPSATVAPSVPASPNVGQAIIGQMGTWAGDPTIGYAFQWQSADDASGTNLADISGANALRYTVDPAYNGKRLRLKVTASNRGGSVIAYSAWSNAVAISAEAEADAIAAAMSPSPTTAHRNLIRDAVLALKTSGAWSKLDGMYGFAGRAAQHACINWKNPAQVGTISGTLTHNDKVGITGGASGYLDTGINPSLGGVSYAQNSACLFVRVLTNVSGTGRPIGVTNGRGYISPRTGGGALNVLLNATSGIASETGVTDSRGFHAATRASSSAIDIRKDTTARITGAAQTSQAVSSGTFRFFNDGTANYFQGQIGYGGFGAALSAAELDAIYAAMETFATGVAAL